MKHIIFEKINYFVSLVQLNYFELLHILNWLSEISKNVCTTNAIELVKNWRITLIDTYVYIVYISLFHIVSIEHVVYSE